MNTFGRIGFIAALVGVNVFAMDSIDPSLIGHYKLDGNALDSSTNAYHGTVYDAAPAPEGVDSGCYSFNGASTAIIVTDPAAKNRFPAGSPVTISCWVKARSFNSDITTLAALDSGRSIQTRASIRLDSLGRPSYYSRAVDRSLCGGALQTNVWHLLTATHEGSTAKLYVNGSMVAETNSFGTLMGPYAAWGLPGWPLPFQDVPSSFSIGSWTDWCGFPGCIFDGLLDDVRFYNRALASDEVKGLYEATLPQNDAGKLVFWNRLGSETEVQNSVVGASALAFAGSFVPGPFGNGLELNVLNQPGLTFPAEILPRSAGCVEFWARVSEVPSVIPAGERVILLGVPGAQGGINPLMHFNGNDGSANGGLCARLSGIGSAGTGTYGYWTYASVLKGASAADWHHYALVWSVDKIGSLTNPVRRVAMYIDGALNTGSWVGAVLPPQPLILPEDKPLAFLYMQGLTSGRVAMDNLKVWDFAKTDFNDRFDENSGATQTYLSVTISNARGESAPANGNHAYGYGEAVSARVPTVFTDGDTRYICTGATIAGNAFTQSGPTNVTLTLTNSATLTWNWATQYRLETQTEGQGTLTPAELWHDADASVVLTATPANGWGFAGWSGDTDGCLRADRTITVPMSQARKLQATFFDSTGGTDSNDPSLIAHYKFDGNAEDSSKNAYHGTVYDAAPVSEGVDSGCYSFNGASTAVLVTDPAAKNRFPAGSPVTISCWVKARSFNSDITTLAALDSGRMIQTRASIRMDSLGRPYYYSRADDRSLSGGALQTNVWYLLTATHEGSRAKLYVNGSMVAETNSFGTLSGPSSIWGLPGWPLPFQDVPASFSIGSWTDFWGFPSCIFDGLMDDVRFYNRALPPDEIKGLYEANPLPLNLVVSGARGDADPISGTHSYIQSSVITASVPASVTEGTTRYVCTGATVEGNAFTQLESDLAKVTLTLTNSATLTWNWATQYRLETLTEGGGTLTPAEPWQNKDASLTLTASPTNGWMFAGWAGDMDGCTSIDNVITVPMTQARLIKGLFIPIVVLSLDDFARLPQNAALKFRRLSGTWRYSNLIGGLFCESPKPRGTASLQIAVNGPGLLTFEWELPGADGTSTLSCAVGAAARVAKKTSAAESVSLVVPSGARNVTWLLKRDSGSPEVSAIIRDIVWKPLEKASAPLPGNKSVLPQREFTGVSWSGNASAYRVYAGLSSKTLKPVGTGTYSDTAVPADAFKDLIATASGKAFYWRVDAVLRDTFGVEAVIPGTVWSSTVLPPGAPEFESALPCVANFKVGVFGELAPLAILRGTPGTIRCELGAGVLPPGMQLEFRDGAVVVTGVPTKPGRYQATLKLSVKPNLSTTIPGATRVLDMTVTELGAASGTFDGWLSNSQHGEGSVRMSVTSKGRITGKFSLSGKTYTFTAPCYDGLSNDCCFVRLEVRQSADDSFAVAVTIGADGQVSAFVYGDPDASLALVRNRWLGPDAGALILPYVGEYRVALPASDIFPETGGVAAFTVSARSRASVSIVGTTANGKKFVSSGTLVYVPEDESQPARLFLVVYEMPTTATERQGLFGVLEITRDPEGLAPNTVTDIAPLTWW